MMTTNPSTTEALPVRSCCGGIVSGNTTCVRIPALILILASFLLSAQSFAVAPTRPNIIFILADDLGWGDLGCYGQVARAAQSLPSIQTPRIDTLAQQGMRFTQFYGAASCAPSRCTLDTGFHLGHSSIRCNSCTSDLPALRTEDINVAEMLKRANYHTGYFGKWHKGGAIENNPPPVYTYGAPQNKGFDSSYVYMGMNGAIDYYPPWLWRNGVQQNIPQNAGGANGVWSHSLFTQEALNFITQNASQPFYLHLAYTIPHKNLECPNNDPYTNQPWPEIEKRFASMITKMDADVGQIIDRVDQLGIGQNTLIIFSSDNGPQDQEGHDPEFFNSNGSLRGIKFDFFEGGIRVPFIARWTEHVPAGTTSDLPAAFYDYMPTAAEVCGVKAPIGIDGISFYPTLTGNAGTQIAHTFLYWEGDDGTSRTVRMGDWKGLTPNAATQLYNLAIDPSETTNVAPGNPAIVASINQIQQSQHSNGPPTVVPPILKLTGQVSGSGSAYTMAFPTLVRGAAPAVMMFQVRNDANGYANLMDGQVTPTGITDSRLSVQGTSYGYVVGSSASDDFVVTLTPSTAGILSNQKITITGVKHGYGTAVANSPITLTLTGTVINTAPSDFDKDGDVDQVDFAVLQRCFSGASPFTAGCAACDFTGDGRVNIDDLTEFLDCMAGPDTHSPCAAP